MAPLPALTGALRLPPHLSHNRGESDMTEPTSVTQVKHGDGKQHVQDVISVIGTSMNNAVEEESRIAITEIAISHMCGDHLVAAMALLAGILAKLDLSADALYALSDDILGTDFVE